MKCPNCNSKTVLKKGLLPKSELELESHYCQKCGQSFVDMKQLGELARKEKALREAKKARFAKWGNSLAIRIPKQIATELSINAGKEALISKEKKALKILLQ